MTRVLWVAALLAGASSTSWGVTITASCPPPPAIQGRSYSFTISATGVSPLSWTLNAPLPPGLTLNSPGTIAGTPSASGTFPISVLVTDSTPENPQSALYSCNLVVMPALTITAPCPAPSGTIGTPYSFPITTTGGANSLYWSLLRGSLPPGLSLNASTGVIQGTPTAAGSYAFSIQVSDSQDQTAIYSCQISIANVTSFSITATCPQSGVVGASYSFAVTVSGTQSVLWSLTSGPLPPGLLLNTATGVISGVPTAAGSYPFTVSVSLIGASAAPQTLSCTLVIVAAVQIGGSCPASAIPAGSAVSLPFTASGGVPPYAWSIGGNSGLSLASAAGPSITVTGTAPATPGSYTLTISVTDAGGSPASSLRCTLSVQGPTPPTLQINGSCPASALNLPLTLSVPLSAAGGQAPYSWTLTGPSWLALSATSGSTTTVANTGAPDTSGPFSFTATLSDSSHTTPVTFACNSSIIAPSPPTISLTAGPPSSGSPLQPTSITLQLPAPALLPLSGVVQLSFVVNAFGMTDNPQVAFDGGSRTASFTLAAGQSSFPLPKIQQGTVAGTIHIEVIALTQGGEPALPVPHPFTDLVIARLAPAIGAADVTFSNETASGFDVVIAGYSTPRDMKSVTLTFTAAQGASFGGSPTVSFTIDISALFTQFYSSAASQLVGSLFQNFHIPIAVSGDKTAIGSVGVTMANSVGNSQTITQPR